MSTFQLNVKGRQWHTYVDAETAGKARYRFLLDVQDAWPDIGFADIECRRVGTPPPTPAQIAAAKAVLFNSAHPVGTWVRYWNGLREGPPSGFSTIKHLATVMGDQAVAWIEGARSCVCITHVESVSGLSCEAVGPESEEVAR